MEFGQELEKRTRKFAVAIIKLSAKLPNTPEGKVIRSLVTKSGTSIGANYCDANRGRSRADFNNKIKIINSESELNETVYWLEIIQEMVWVSEEKLVPVVKECCELLALFSSISKNSNNFSHL